MRRFILLLFVVVLPMVVIADAVEIDGIYYNLIPKGNVAEVTRNPNSSGNVIIPEKLNYNGAEYSVTSIGDNAFNYCRGLTSITIPCSVKSVGVAAFRECIKLTSVHISDIETWCEIDFPYDYGLMDVSSNPLHYAHHLFLNGEEVVNLVLPNSVTSIGSGAFCDCYGLSSITIPNSVRTIGDHAFKGCSGLTSITIPNSVTSIGWRAFCYCRGLTSIVIPNSVTNIGRSAFSNCSGLTSVTIPQCVINIDKEVFYGCSSLTSVTIPNNVTSIGDYAFAGCSGLTSVTIPNNVTSIGNYAFNGCSGLTSVIIGNGCKTINSEAFANCSELIDVYCYAENVPNAFNDAFSNSYIEYAMLHVPSASIDAYKVIEPWKNFKSIMGVEGTITEVKRCATPTINYINGKLKFICETEDVEFVSEVTVADAQKYYSNEVNLTVTYNISVYATKVGYDNSDVSTATLCWIDQQPQTEGIADGVANVPAKAVLIQSQNGVIIIQGADEGAVVNVYDISGARVETGISCNGVATINTNLKPSSIAIVKVGEKSVKIVAK